MRMLAMPALRPYIKYYWHISGPESQYAQMIIPNGCARICIARKSEMWISHDFRPADIHSHQSETGVQQQACTMRSALIGAGAQYLVAYLDGVPDTVGVELSLLGTYLIRQLGISRLRGNSIPLSATAHQPTMDLEHRILNARTTEECTDILNQYFMQLLQEQDKADPNIHRLQQIQMMSDLNCLNSVAQMADVTCLCPRQLSRILSSTVGISPSDLVTLARYRYSVEMMHAHRDWPLWQIAERSGYASLSHMSRDYSRINGHTPGMIMSDLKAYTTGPESSLFLTTQRDGITYMCNLI